jgi:beta-galactosidase/beta-glucuronidase
MQKTSFNHGWGVRRQTSPFLEIMGQAQAPVPVTLPHDWLISQPRSADNQPGGLTGYYGEDVIEYVKTFHAPEGYREGRVEIQFDGVYRGAMIFVNDAFVGQRPYGYIPFSVRIDPYLHDGDNEIRVECRNHFDARWYSGLGIYRDTHLLVGPPLHVARNGVKIRTISADAETAVVGVITELQNDSKELHTVKVVTELVDKTGTVVAAESASLAVRPAESARLRQQFTVDAPQRWSVDSPSLYTCRTRLEPSNSAGETVETSFGIRTLEWDVRHGMRINGETVKLRGGCIHHDNGLIGAATIARAEERRVELLKEAGYNAIRSAHNPISAAMLDACDRLGMLVLDEFTDGWTSSGLGFGYGVDMNEWWRRDLTEMLERDYNHPSVIMYSIGNEVSDTGNTWGAIHGRDMVDFIKTLDDTRPVTNAINPMMTVLHDLKAQVGQQADDAGGVNSFMRDFGELTKDLVASDLATERLEEAMSQVDIPGYNYAYGRYELDMKQHPQRLLVGTEGLPNKLDEVWDYVKRHPQVIGEFSWTAWEYIGEAGLGADKPAEEAFFGNYPWRLSMTADHGVTGQRRTLSYWREVVWGLRTTPYIAVHRPDIADKESLKASLYTWSDSVSSWTWGGYEGTPMTVEVYSDAEEIELLLNGQTIGRAPAGETNRFMAVFQVDYQPGELVAVAYRNGQETAREVLQSAAATTGLTATPDRTEIRADENDLAFVTISIADNAGIIDVLDNTAVTVTVSGNGVLQGLGSADPKSEDNYASSVCTTFLGQALAIIRPTGPGEIKVSIESEKFAAMETVIKAI